MNTTSTFPVIHSILSPTALATDIVSKYAMDTPAGCRFIEMGLNDTYLVRTETERYILRIYRSGWRTEDDIRYEFDALMHLRRQGVQVSVPIPDRDGSLLHELGAPEGIRYAALFTYAQGKGDDCEAETARYFGAAAARIHNASGEIVSRHSRYALDLRHLIDAPLASVQPFLAHRPTDHYYLQRLCDRVHLAVSALSSEGLDVGFCHGDLHGGNAHISDDKIVTFFDFDCCGEGWRAYDIAVYRWSALLNETETLRWPAFLRGYQEHRALAAQDLRASSLFVVIRHVWFLGLLAELSVDHGSGLLNDEHWDKTLKFLRERDEECVVASLLTS